MKAYREHSSLAATALVAVLATLAFLGLVAAGPEAATVTTAFSQACRSAGLQASLVWPLALIAGVRT
ncbi:hypothetical protein BH11PSE9_BH11PSE9_16140 [soil metagenome]